MSMVDVIFANGPSPLDQGALMARQWQWQPNGPRMAPLKLERSRLADVVVRTIQTIRQSRIVDDGTPIIIRERRMKNLRLLSTTAAVLLLGVGAVSAQGMMNDQAPGRAPAAEQNAPAEKIAPALKPGEHKTPETTGQATPDEHQKGQMGNGSGMMNGTQDKANEPRAESDSKTKSSTSDNAGPATTKSSQSRTQTHATTTGQGAAAGSAKLSSEQHTKISAIIRAHKVAPARLKVSVRVGTRVPDSVHFYPLPREVFAIYPEWRGYDYIMVGNEIIVLNPRTHEIVAILDA
jgi:hypothetical protein